MKDSVLFQSGAPDSSTGSLMGELSIFSELHFLP